MATIDNLWAAVSFFGLAIFFIAVMVAWSNLNTLNAELWDQSSIGQDIRASADRAVSHFDFILMMAYFGIHLGVLVLAYFLRSHPVIFVAGIAISIVLALVAAPLSNAYEDFRSNTDVAAVTDDIPLTNNVLQNLPKYEVVWGFITLIFLLGFTRID